MHVVITGASGNVGTAVLRALSTRHDITGVVRRPPAALGEYGRVDWRSVDLTDPDATAALRPIFDGADAVVHLAWGFQPTRDTGYLTELGVGGTSAVLQAAHSAGVGHLVHMSSVGTYAPGFTAYPGQPKECESGNEPYAAGRKEIGNPAGTQPAGTEGVK